jgi:hypothetical protein
VGEALRTSKEAEEQRAVLQQQLEQQQAAAYAATTEAMQAAVGQQAAFDSQLAELTRDKGARRRGGLAAHTVLGGTPNQ